MFTVSPLAGLSLALCPQAASSVWFRALFFGTNSAKTGCAYAFEQPLLVIYGCSQNWIALLSILKLIYLHGTSKSASQYCELIMVIKNAQDWTPKNNKQVSDFGDVEAGPGSMGVATDSCQEHGAYPFSASRDDSDATDSVINRERTFKGITGKIVSQLTEEVEKQLAYHKNQVRILESRLDELKKIPESDKNG